MSVRTARRMPATRLLALSGAALLVSAAAMTGLGAGTSSASSHREAPLTAGDPQADNTDTYAFVSPDNPDTVTLVSNWIPFEEPNGGPNFYPFATDAHYDMHIDNDGDGKADVTYQWTFTNHTRDDSGQFLYDTGVVKNLTDPTLNFYQTYDLDKIDGAGQSTNLIKDAIAAPSDTGKASMPDYGALRTQAIKALPSGGQTYVGQADDSFFLDLRVFDLLYGGDLSEAGHDTLSGYNVNTIALQVPKSELSLNGDATKNPVIGTWSTTERRSTTVLKDGTATKSGDFVQVSRLGNPLVNEVVIPLKYKDAFNSLPPSMDHTIAPVVAKVTNPIVPALIQAIYGLPAPAGPRNDLVEIFLTGIAKNAPTLDKTKAPIQADLNSQVLNGDVKAASFVPAEELRLNTSVAPAANPSPLGLLAGDTQGFPNGRRLTDDVVDIELQALEGAAATGKIVPALKSGDGVSKNDVAFGTAFPYVALPHDGSVNAAGQAQSANASGSGSSGTSGSTSTGTGSSSGSATTPTGAVASGAGGTAKHGVSALVPLTAGLGGLLLLTAGAVSLRRNRRSVLVSSSGSSTDRSID